MMVALLLYAYCVGERSSRRIEQLCERDVAFRIVAANQMPDHVTIARRQPHARGADEGDRAHLRRGREGERDRP
jgi:hypothetical protein